MDLTFSLERRMQSGAATPNKSIYPKEGPTVPNHKHARRLESDPDHMRAPEKPPPWNTTCLCGASVLPDCTLCFWDVCNRMIACPHGSLNIMECSYQLCPRRHLRAQLYDVIQSSNRK